MNKLIFKNKDVLPILGITICVIGSFILYMLADELWAFIVNPIITPEVSDVGAKKVFWNLIVVFRYICIFSIGIINMSIGCWFLFGHKKYISISIFVVNTIIVATLFFFFSNHDTWEYIVHPATTPWISEVETKKVFWIFIVKFRYIFIYSIGIINMAIGYWFLFRYNKFISISIFVVSMIIVATLLFFFSADAFIQNAISHATLGP